MHELVNVFSGNGRDLMLTKEWLNVPLNAPAVS